MTPKHNQNGSSNPPNPDRRRILGAAGGGVIASMLGGAFAGAAGRARAQNVAPLRWGIVGTGSIANSMAPRIKEAASCDLVAVSSRRMESADEFAERHGVRHRFDSWAAMAESDIVDALYVATPTSVKEEICIAAAGNGKHVLGEKPFAALPSLQNITAACRANGVGFMDGTHFVHHPRTLRIKADMHDEIGWPWSVDSAFQFFLPDRNNIRYNSVLEPMGAIGDTGWYNMRAAVEYLAPDVEMTSVSAYLRRDSESDACISGSGVIKFDDGSTTTWNCGFDSGAVIMDLRISGTTGSINIDNFLSNDRDGSAEYRFRRGGWGPNATNERIRVPAEHTGSTLMFEDFAGMVGNAELIEKSMRASERTQALLDAVWTDARRNE